MRLDRLLADALGCGRREARRLLRSGTVAVDGRRLGPGERPRPGAVVEVFMAAAEPEASLEAYPRLLWTGRGLIALAKPAGMHSEMGAGRLSVAAFLRRLRPGIEGVSARRAESGLVHRLDRDTSGLVLAATDHATYRRVREMFSHRKVEKHYLALVEGRVSEAFSVDVPLARRRSRVVAARSSDHRLHASTRVALLDCGKDWSLVTASMVTGVTHQVRAHLSLAGHPLIGDGKYGGPPAPPATRRGQLLHALRVKFAGGPDLSAPVPHDMLTALRSLRTR